ncbi:MAG: 16S rRNA (cytosine(1402)-N(4))-methyltransferase RsmH [Patescibacteria group bacterium]
MTIYHQSILVVEVVAHLQVKKGGKYIDATLGDGGHAIEILKLGGKVLSIDLDPDALERAKQRITELNLGSFWQSFEGNFRDIFQIATNAGFGEVEGVIYDLGTSLLELSDPKRGFSFYSGEPLDMRMSPKLGVTAKDLVNALPEKSLAKLIFTYGEDRFANIIARAVVNARKEKDIVSCKELAELIYSVVPRIKGVSIHPATKTFQALRIAVNDELTNLEVSFGGAEKLLIPGGKLVVITFHSLEDKIAKSLQSRLKEVAKVLPSEEEITRNPRSRSAKVRIFEKL